ncbi:phosphopantothenoylcysteine decarboxylase [Phtheirospermum japonicum]|uniref:phosphopantothenoylcysteine decarboxylase n=1 Tax=Phtheirospermum japonicum TaxID=374723 RepID=A0A830CYP9_9LAMI|nr:phosphopantothenoylcysteine decarboxylase [Phtheirospermum japonicum]
MEPIEINGGFNPNGGAHNEDEVEAVNIQDLVNTPEQPQGPDVFLNQAAQRPRFVVAVCGTSGAQRLFNLLYAFVPYAGIAVVVTRSAAKIMDCSHIPGVPIFTDEFQWSSWLALGENISEKLCAWAQLVVVVPASSNTLTKIALGLSDNLLTTVVKSYLGPVFLVPDMSPEMWMNPVTGQRVQELVARGYSVMDPPSVAQEGEPQLPPLIGPMDDTPGNVVNWVMNNFDPHGQN